MHKNGLLIGAVLGLLSVVIGAFGAHGLKDILEENGRLDVFETAVKYQMYHAFALLFTSLLAEKINGNWATRAIFCFVIGVLIFSGSLYVLSISNIGMFGAITPIGGLFLIVGWVFVILGVIKN
ncbi:MAG: DUF423 domain-containing protein [Reichenbachiella sp.]|uniref:DUF423 domain-containing protein n=1 Tax=Reichenbachiella sp. TaxID=2184521 RepID=UPI0032987B3D